MRHLQTVNLSLHNNYVFLQHSVILSVKMEARVPHQIHVHVLMATQAGYANKVSLMNTL